MENKLEITFYVAGIAHHQISKCFDQIEVGNHLQMTPEPTNKYDPNAIRLEFSDPSKPETTVIDSVMIGYVPMKISEDITSLMIKQDFNCKITEFNKDSAPYKQIKVVIEEV